MAQNIDGTDIICLATYHGRGGAQNNAAKLVRRFRERGLKASLVFLKEREPNVTFDGVADSHTMIANGSGPLSMVQASIRFNRFVRDTRPKAIFGFFPMSNIAGAIAAKQLDDCAFVGSLRNPSGQQNRVITPIERWVGASRMTRSVVAVSQTVANSFADYPQAYVEKIRVVYNTTPKLPETTDQREACRQAFNLPQDVRILGSLGRLHTQKNVGHAVASLAALSDQNAILAIAGEGPEEESIRALARDLGVSNRVRFLGPVSGADVTRFYRAIDLFLFPSIYEGFGLTLVEAMSQRCPVVCSDIEITREVAADAAALVPLDVPAWAKRIDELLISPQARNDLVENGLLRNQFFGNDAKMVDGYLKAAGLIA